MRVVVCRVYPILILLITAGCAAKPLSMDELDEYIGDESHGLIKKEHVDEWVVSVSYLPSYTLAFQQVEGDSYSSSQVDSVIAAFSPYYYFRLRLEQEGAATTLDQRRDLLPVLAYHLDEYVLMTSSSHDTVRVADFTLNRSFGLSKMTEVLFAFDKTKLVGKDYITFSLYEFGLRTGKLRFKFLSKDIQSIPRVSFYPSEENEIKS